MSDKFKAGQIVNYEHLWSRHAKEGQVNGEKPRTACLSMVVRDDAQGITHLIILPIASKAPKVITMQSKFRRLSFAGQGLQIINPAGLQSANIIMMCWNGLTILIRTRPRAAISAAHS